MRDPVGAEFPPPRPRAVTPMPELPPQRRPSRLGRFILAVLPALIILGLGAYAGFVKPGYLRAPLLDQVTVQDGVRTVLTDNYGLPNVTSVSCPSGQRIRPGLEFDCVARLGNAPATVHVVVQDAAGTYLVNRPVLHP